MLSNLNNDAIKQPEIECKAQPNYSPEFQRKKGIFEGGRNKVQVLKKEKQSLEKDRLST